MRNEDPDRLMALPKPDYVRAKIQTSGSRVCTFNHCLVILFGPVLAPSHPETSLCCPCHSQASSHPRPTWWMVLQPTEVRPVH